MMADHAVHEELPVMPTVSSWSAAYASLRRSHPDDLPDRTLVVRDVRGTTSHLAAYDRICGFRLSDLVPATFPHVLAFPLAMRLMSGPDFPFPVIGTIHIANAITQRRPISVRDPVTVAMHAVDLRPHPRGRQFDLVATASVDGEEVWREVSTYLRRLTSTSASSAERSPTAATEPSAPTAVWRVGRDVGRAYAAASGDRNPIHTSWLGARALGFPGPIVHGMWTAARCLAALEGRLPEAYTMDVTLKRPLPLGSTVAFRSARTEGGWTFDVSNATSGMPHLTGSVTAH